VVKGLGEHDLANGAIPSPFLLAEEASMLPMNWGPLYRLGPVVLTPNARARVSDDDVATALLRHFRTACGESGPCRCRARPRPRLDACRILSACRAGNGTRFWIITEADPKRTQVLLPEEY
jgi:hypothetical protein